MRESADDVVCPWVSGELNPAGEAHEQFDQTTDDEVWRILKSVYRANKGVGAKRSRTMDEAAAIRKSALQLQHEAD